jgi:hypothetical protein
VSFDDPDAYVLLFVVVYPPVIFVLLPDVLLCVLVSFATAAVANSIVNNISSFFISPPEENL